MKKIAIFVEGHTELELTKKLLSYICTNKGYSIEIKEQLNNSLHHVSISSHNNMPISHYVLIVNCRNESQVKSQILAQYGSLQNSGYSKIIGLRDIYPKQHNEIQAIQNSLNVGLTVDKTPIDLILAVLEVETWFIGETSHFGRINPPIRMEDVEKITLSWGTDITQQPVEDIQHPAKTLNSIYNHVGLSYRKRANQITRTVNALCMATFFGTTRKKSPSLNALLSSIESAIA